MKILMINYEYPPVGGGGGNAMKNIAERLAAKGESVVVLTSHFRGLPRRSRESGVEILRVPTLRRKVDRCTPVEMVAFMAASILPALVVGLRLRPDVCCAFFGVPSGPVALLMRWLLRIPYVVSLRGGDVPGFLGAEMAPLHRLSKPLILAVWRNAAGIVSNGEH